MKKTKQTVLAILIGTTLIASCQKEGCTDRDAENFSSEAKSDDGTCSFEGSIVFWYNQNTAQDLDDLGITSLAYYVDGKLVGSSAASVYYTNRPDCGSDGTVTVSKNLMSEKTRTYSYKVVDAQTGVKIWEETISFEANTCTSLKLS